mgnify:FL=1
MLVLKKVNGSYSVGCLVVIGAAVALELGSTVTTAPGMDIGGKSVDNVLRNFL